MTDQAAFLRAICENPADDAPRLQFSDWLEEREGTVRCQECITFGYMGEGRECGLCLGTGRISNGNAERAEFIRVQVELAKGPQCKTTVSGIRRTTFAIGLNCGTVGDASA